MRVHQSLLDDCGRRMQYKLETPGYYGGSVRALGSGYHKGVEVYYLDRQADGFYLPTEAPIGRTNLAEIVSIAKDEFTAVCEGTNTSHVSEEGRERGGFIWNKNVPDLETGYDMLDVMLGAYFNPDTGGVWPEDWDVLGVEQFFELPWTGRHTRGGSIDLILHHPGTDTVVGDDQKTAGRRWPTGKEKPRKNAQASWYSWAIRELFPDHQYYLSTFSVVTYKGQFERRESNPNETHINTAAVLLHETVASYEVLRANGMDMPANPSSTLCSPEYCDYFSICPFGSVVD